MSEPHEQASDQSIQVLDHGFVRLDDAMADDLSVVNGARVSFAKRKEEMNDADAGLIRFLMRTGTALRSSTTPSGSTSAARSSSRASGFAIASAA